MDQIQAMKAFVATVDQGSFTKAADKMNISKPVLTRLVAGLEKNLGVKLLQRSTRSLSLTEAGASYLATCRNVFSLLDEAESELALQTECPRGRLRISAPMVFSMIHLGDVVSEFMREYSNIEVELELNDRRVDLIEEAFDLSIRISDQIEPGLIARKVASTRLITCASPEYLKQHGTPEIPQDLSLHNCLVYSMQRRNSWQFCFDGQSHFIEVDGLLRSNNGLVLAELAEKGHGIVQTPCFIVSKALKNGQLEKVLSSYDPPEMGIYCVYQSRDYLPQKVRLFIDFMLNYFSENREKITSISIVS